MKTLETPSYGPAQREKLDEVIRKIKNYNPNVGLYDGDATHVFGLSVRDLVIELQTLAAPILPDDVVIRLKAINMDDVYTLESVCEAHTKLQALVPAVEDALASIDGGLVPSPNTDLPDDIKRDYREAAAIVEHSPRGAAALLRLCIQKLCIHLGEPGKNLSKDIDALVTKKNLSTTVQKAFDSVRLVGNNAVHPGKLDLKDDIETAKKLFNCVNWIANHTITQPKEISEIHKHVTGARDVTN